MDDFGDYYFVVFKMIYYDVKADEIMTEQVSLLITRKTVISFQERTGDVFDPIRKRIREEKSRIRKMGADFLAYSLMDVVVDNYFVIIEKVGEQVEGLEKVLIEKPMPKTLRAIQRLKTDMIFLRRSIWPLREVIGSLEKGDSELIKKSTRIFFKDVYDHTIQVMDAIEMSRDMLSGMLEIYLSSVSNRMNEVMKVLTVIATIFIPLTFITGIYGMNFRNMPELGWGWGYFAVLGLMAGIVTSMLAYFKKKGWF